MAAALAELTDQERSALWERAEQIMHQGPQAVRPDDLPQRIRRAVQRFGEDSGTTGFLLLRGLEVGRLPPPTPTANPPPFPATVRPAWQ
ncbi:hypothetical protein LUW75_00175 [Streptomyces sp. MRC013]|uniref:hypothetical protein n=1 Tax=Streptomyces sp. MRC013 TaxID=2898276 RepID=UPI0020261E1A|nr:hypothetical protein [Streptomyces sp. MRC013]URM88700.1 hypothetical protein LUW75_00175 [Streptomyces sp. MRC013]